MTSANASLIGLTIVALVLAGCHQKPAAEDTESANVPRRVASARDPSAVHIYLCPMDKDIRSYEPGKCPRCGMTLVTSIPEPAEYRLDLRVDPPPQAGRPARLTFEVFDPGKGNRVTRFGIVHEKLFHAFIVGRDLEFFVHNHPEWKDGVFQHDIVFPKPGMYRVLGDFYPEAATPQLLTQTVFVPGDEGPPPRLVRDYSEKPCV